MTKKTNIIITGANGRMGKEIIKAIALNKDSLLVGAVEMAENPSLGIDAGLNAGQGKNGVLVSSDVAALLENNVAVMIDFSYPEATIKNLSLATKNKTPVVIGTTGFTEEQERFIKECAAKVPLVMAPNMSTGVNVVLNLVKQAAKALGSDFDIEIIEAHHRFKKDAPSGTAKALAKSVCEGSQKKYPEDLVFHREGVLEERAKNHVGMQVIRGGDIVGEHTVLFCGEGERVEIKHVATSRQTFAQGAVRAACWLVGQKPGLYSMKDVLQLV
ncbi:MAG: 4-hydroxy-tetrahydrodipicolinate reductase [bacterium]